MAEFGFELDEIRRLIKLVEERGLERLSVHESGRAIEILGLRGQAGRAPEALDSAPAESLMVDDLPEATAELEEQQLVVTSPVVGVYYRSPSPDSAPFVEVGDRVEVGQPVGLIEAMKVFSEVTSDHAGIVTEIVAENGRLVKQGEALLRLRSE